MQQRRSHWEGGGRRTSKGFGRGGEGKGKGEGWGRGCFCTRLLLVVVVILDCLHVHCHGVPHSVVVRIVVGGVVVILCFSVFWVARGDVVLQDALPAKSVGAVGALERPLAQMHHTMVLRQHPTPCVCLAASRHRAQKPLGLAGAVRMDRLHVALQAFLGRIPLAAECACEWLGWLGVAGLPVGDQLAELGELGFAAVNTTLVHVGRLVPFEVPHEPLPRVYELVAPDVPAAEALVPTTLHTLRSVIVPHLVPTQLLLLAKRFATHITEVLSGFVCLLVDASVVGISEGLVAALITALEGPLGRVGQDVPVQVVLPLVTRAAYATHVGTRVRVDDDVPLQLASPVE
mmetsp:Transcript_29042/g.83939  ORF Transcript_29042/g.83939 Transcript_29042/m.83939 type:complete len:346 (+) Transcript_29042:801-1838(+)